MYTSRHLISKKWFTLVELIVGMTIFAVGMTGILAMLNAAISTSLISRHEIVAANLLREQVELVKNARNTNVRNFAHWSKINVGWNPAESMSGIYVIENNFSTNSILYTGGDITNSPISFKNIAPGFPNSIDGSGRFEKSALYLDEKWRFTHTATTQSTNFASYIIISPLVFDAGSTHVEPLSLDSKNQGYILDARVIVKGNPYREYDLKTVITDWQR